MVYLSKNTEDTERIAFTWAEAARPGSLYCLRGGLGAGKTAFARGFARGLGFLGRVTSPTFCLLNEYIGGRLPMYHFDVYRLSRDDMDDICYPDYFYGDGVCLIEWADNIADLIPPGAFWVTIRERGGSEAGEGAREIIFDRGGEHAGTGY